MFTGPHTIRLRFMLVIMALLWLILFVRIGDIQFFKHEKSLKNAVSQSVKPVTLTASRGRIIDRNNVPLTVNLLSASYGVRPEEVANVGETARILSTAADISQALIETKLASKKPFFWLVRQANASMIRDLDRADIKGLHKLQGSRRYYPLGKVGAQVIGYTDVDGKGIEGCELYVDDDLSGWNGRSRVFKDAKGKEVQSFDRPDVEPLDGLDVALTIDCRIQEIVEEELEETVHRLKAGWGGAIVLNPANGEILAMSNVPRLNPNDPASFTPDVIKSGYWRNRLVTDMFEPGSTYKIVVFIEALESGVLHEMILSIAKTGSIRYIVTQSMMRINWKLFRHGRFLYIPLI